MWPQSSLPGTRRVSTSNCPTSRALRTRLDESHVRVVAEVVLGPPPRVRVASPASFGLARRPRQASSRVRPPLAAAVSAGGGASIPQGHLWPRHRR